MSEITLYNKDCLEIMKTMADKSVDLALTDPPYGIDVIKKTFNHKNSKPGKCLAHKTYWQDEEWDKKPITDEYIYEILRISKYQIIWGGQYYLHILGNCKGFLIWDKKNDGCDQASCEMAWNNLGCSNRIFRHLWRGMLQEDMKNKEIKYHPTIKPLNLMKWCIQRKEDIKSVIDPFMGSGTTGIACKELGCNFIGVEISLKYFEIAKKRINETSTQETLL
jgi:DNA modification methylase